MGPTQLATTQARGVTEIQHDGCVRVDHCSYAARPARIGSKVLVRTFARCIEIRELTTQGLLRTHPRAERPGTVVLLGARYPRYLVDRACAQVLDEGIYSYSHAKRLTEKFVAQELQAFTCSACAD